MSLYTIGDLHLSLNSNKPMDVFGQRWENYVEKIKFGLSQLNDDDICVICGDVSWGMSLQEAILDFKFIDNLPGRKIILKGNHDYWWNTSSKIQKFFADNDIKNIFILHNNSFEYDGISICGSRGWFYEEMSNNEHDDKILKREVMRLEKSLSEASCSEKIAFLHYPPVFKDYICPEIVQTLKRYNVNRCYYGHIHGYGCVNSFNGRYEGIEFKLVSADYLNFMPLRIGI